VGRGERKEGRKEVHSTQYTLALAAPWREATRRDETRRDERRELSPFVVDKDLRVFCFLHHQLPTLSTKYADLVLVPKPFSLINDAF
jgi:hypothetical protein